MVVGWIAVGISLLLSCFWAWWGILENFHEGWYHSTLIGNILLTAAYIAPSLFTMSIVLLSIRLPTIGGSLIMALGLFLILWWLYQQWPPTPVFAIHIVTISGLLLIILGILFRFGTPEPRKWAYIISVVLPLVIILGFGFKPALRVASRIDDGNRDIRIVTGNEIRLAWAPEGPGWPLQGKKLEEAIDIVSRLNQDGKSVSDQVLNIWRLPTVEEVVKSMTRHGKNVNGTWNEANHKAYYKISPDKESPLWSTTSPIIYWWTASEESPDRVFVVCYNGNAFSKSKKLAMGSLGFRAVRDVSDSSDSADSSTP